ncbi:MAG: hypothetical protein ACLP9L_04750 [Thermoguttaceae bacterium]
MAKKKRLSPKTQAERIRAGCRRSRVAELYLKGTRTQTELAAVLSVSQQCISKDLAFLAEEWKAKAVTDFDVARTQELERLDRTEQAAWAGWDRSCTDKLVITDEESKNPEKPGKHVERRHGQCGDPRFLRVVVDVVERRCDILGLDAPEKHAIFSAETPDEMDPDFLALAREIGERRKLEREKASGGSGQTR